jgi:DNA recombination protein RmuC
MRSRSLVAFFLFGATFGPVWAADLSTTSKVAAVSLGGLLFTALFFGAGFLLGRYVWPLIPSAEQLQLQAARNEIENLKADGARARANNDALLTELKSTMARANAAREENATLTERMANAAKKDVDQKTQIREMEQQRNSSVADVSGLQSEISRLREREANLTARIAEQTEQLQGTQKKLTAEFENIANRLLKQTAADLTVDSQKGLATILDPLRERILEFQQKVEKTFEAETRDVLSLKAEIKLMAETSHTIGSHADGLAKALRGDSQLLGRWGELVLERILDAAGLKDGREYVTQGSGLGLKDPDGRIQRPDIIVRLPENRTLIIDSKIPLASYERLAAVKDNDERSACSHAFVKDFKTHIDGLAGKRYQENERLQAHDCVLMFIPIEGALAAALAADPDLFLYAWDRRVALVGPPTLLMTMRTVASIWRYERQGQNAKDIARLAGDLCDKVMLSVTDFSLAAEQISGALDAQREALKRLSTGRGNALWIGQRIRDLGVKTRRPIPETVDGLNVIDDGDNEPDAEPTTASGPVGATSVG